MWEVVVGLIHRDGRYLIARRRAGTHFAGLWEFPGGKREPGESLVECLHRELYEELGIRIDVPVPYRVVRHCDQEREVELHFFRCSIKEGEPAAIECEEIQWVRPEELSNFQFPPADHAIIESLQREEEGLCDESCARY
ncbi:MAG: (deoxy)nucleoside triphosphate pyrophosphohydrolase [Nitrospira sp.]|nr:(deoxy)nucleoside triphosphate pyrophosphohydrolase [Nitrospira sp.]